MVLLTCSVQNLWKRTNTDKNESEFMDTIYDLVGTLQLTQAARRLPSRTSSGTLSGQLAFLYNRLDRDLHSADALIPVLKAVMESQSDTQIWGLIYETLQDYWYGRQKGLTASSSKGVVVSESAYKRLLQQTVEAEARATQAEGSQKETLDRTQKAVKMLLDLIKLTGPDATAAMRSLPPLDIQSSTELASSSEEVSNPRFTEHRALWIPEMLEQILLCLPMSDLFQCQSVSAHWKSVIDISPRLQEALHF